MKLQLCLVATVMVSCFTITTSLKLDECEVCITFLQKFADSLTSDEKASHEKIETKFKDTCSSTKGKENRFCYYIGGLKESATGILNEMSKPLSWGMPAIKVCEKLKKKDAQICDLRYEKQIDFSNVDLKKLKVRDLKKILNDWDETCDDCLEKSDYIKRIEYLIPQYVRQEL